MIYWLKRLEWKIRKALGFQKKRIKTIGDVKGVYNELFWKVMIILAIIYGIIIVGEAIAKVWIWFFPRIVRLPVIPV